MSGHVWVALAMLAVGSGGCATSRGGVETIAVESDPAGADVLAQCGTARLTAVTPGYLLVSRKLPNCAVTIRKDGYSEAHAVLERGVDGWFWVDMAGLPISAAGMLNTAMADETEKTQGYTIAVLGLVPLAVDLATGNFRDHDPKQLKFVLHPLRGVQ
jgi:hypothetical protein